MFDRLQSGLDRHRQHAHMMGLLQQSKTPAQNITDAIRLCADAALVLNQSSALISQSKTICCHSAKAVCTVENARLAIHYTGSISLSTILQIDLQTAQQRLETRWALERMDTACTMFEAGAMAQDTRAWPAHTPPSAVIVRPDQHASALAFCRLLRRCGILRMCFFPHQVNEARDFLEQSQG